MQSGHECTMNISHKLVHASIIARRYHRYMNQHNDQYPIDKRSGARQGQAHTAPRLEGVVKNKGTRKILKVKSEKKPKSAKD